MSDLITDLQSVVTERTFAQPPHQVWRALTQPQLIGQWLMANDFSPVVGHSFTLTADWGVVDGVVLEAQPETALAYTWEAQGLSSVVRWTLSPAGTGTHLRLEHSGFRPDEQQAYRGARAGWPQYFGALERLLARTA